MKNLATSTFLILLVAGLGLMSYDAGAQTTTFWDGGSSGTSGFWSLAANWSGDTMPPNATDSDIVFKDRNGTGTLVGMSVSGSRVFGLMTFDNINAKLPASLTIDTNSSGSTSRSLTLYKGVTLQNTTTSVVFTGANGTLSWVLGADNTFTISAGSTLQIASSVVVSGGFRLTKEGLGTVLVDAANTFTGGVTINAGTFKMTRSTGFGASPATYVSDQIVLNGGTFEYASASNTFSAANRGFSIGNNGGTIRVSGAGSYAISGIVADLSGQTGALTKTGQGILTLEAASTYSGGTTIASGTLRVGVSGALGAAGGMVYLGSLGGGDASLINYLGGYVFANDINVVAGSGGVLTLGYTSGGAFTSRFSGNITLNDDLVLESESVDTFALRLTGAISGSKNLTKTGTGTVRLENNNTAYSGITTISAGTLQLGNAGTTGGLGSGAIVNNGTLIINRTNTLTLSNDVSGTGSLVQAGTGITTIANTSFNNSWAGGTTISSGTLQAGKTGALGTGAVTLGSVGGGDATLESYLGGYTLANNITVASGSGGTLTLYYSSTGAFTGTLSGDITLNDNLVIRSDAASGFSMRMTGAITGSNNITKTGVGVLRLENNNTGYTGTTTISAGTLKLGNAGTTGGIGSGSIVDNAALLLARSNAITLSSQISGTGTLTQSGTGTATLSNANTYSGGTAVSAGSLLVTNTTGSATGTGAVSVAAGTILGGTGTISPTGTNSVVVTGTLSPGVAGTGIGTLTFTPVNGNVTMQSASVIVFELGASHTNDKIVFAASGSGVMDFSAMTAGSLSVTFVGGYTPVLNDSFDLLDWSAVSGTGITGLDASLLNLSTAGFDPSWTWDTTLFNTTGVVTVISSVPEPSRTLLVACGLTGAALRRRRVQ